jgi:hypothetical protein
MIGILKHKAHASQPHTSQPHTLHHDYKATTNACQRVCLYHRTADWKVQQIIKTKKMTLDTARKLAPELYQAIYSV